jgi:hypothetical protein
MNIPEYFKYLKKNQTNLLNELFSSYSITKQASKYSTVPISTETVITRVATIPTRNETACTKLDAAALKVGATMEQPGPVLQHNITK